MDEKWVVDLVAMLDIHMVVEKVDLSVAQTGQMLVVLMVV